MVVTSSEQQRWPPRALANGIAGACFAVIAQTGHFPFSEEPTRFHGTTTYLDHLQAGSRASTSST